MCIIWGIEDLWLEGGDEEEEFEQDIAEEIIALELWDPANPDDDSIWYKEEKIVDPNEENDL